MVFFYTVAQLKPNSKNSIIVDREEKTSGTANEKGKYQQSQISRQKWLPGRGIDIRQLERVIESIH